ncbi:hypothetical protein GQY15_21590 [Rhodobacter sphaeroides]|uniref:hypothetical protein n=1 Tax=Cereibacter sphaeroides TaxID=1063 RepID=UPI001329010E|nr:hypothetical protein [Cereibacter sphaeroides]MWP40142.1 hypothetical protein [Cereibacter sphaeroides]
MTDALDLAEITRLRAELAQERAHRGFLGEAEPPTWQAIAHDVARVLSEDCGVWVSCTGCYATDEGYPTAGTDPVFGCALGMGCRECGGLGAVWDPTDWSAFAVEDEGELSRDAAAAPGSGGAP